MKLTRLMPISANCILLMLFVDESFAQTWQVTSAPTNFWNCIASSANGSNLVASDGLVLYTSTNSGTDWFPTPAPKQAWVYVASSADGSKLAAVANNFLSGGPVYTSTNSGGNWQRSGGSLFAPWSAIASSADGNHLAAVGYYDVIYTSGDAGTTWSTNSGAKPDAGGWECIASSADGSKLVAVASDPFSGIKGSIYCSTNAGMDWMLTTAPKEYWWTVASSVDGSRLVAAAGSGQTASGVGPIYTSTNSGSTWDRTSAPEAGWVGVSSSADGVKLAAVVYHGPIYTSIDSGITWVQNDAPTNNWFFVASSSDGNKLAAAAGGFEANGQIYIRQTAPAPLLNINATGTNALISWLIPSSSLSLQQSFDLGASNWVDVSEPVLFDFTTFQNQVTISVSGTNAFFRLAAH